MTLPTHFEDLKGKIRTEVWNIPSEVFQNKFGVGKKTGDILHISITEFFF